MSEAKKTLLQTATQAAEHAVRDRDPLDTRTLEIIVEAVLKAQEDFSAELQDVDGTEPRPTIHGGNIGGDGIPFYLQPGQRAPEYDQGDFVVVWYDDLYNLDQRARKTTAATTTEDMCYCGHFRDWHFYGSQNCFARGGECQCARFDLKIGSGTPPPSAQTGVNR